MSPAALSDESNQESGRKRDAEHAEMIRNLQEHEKQLGITHDVLRNVVSQLGDQLNAAIEHRTRLESANQIDNARWARQLEEERNRRKRSDDAVVKLQEENRASAQDVENLHIRLRSDIEIRDRAIAEADAREEAVRQELFATQKLLEESRAENNQLKVLLARQTHRVEQRQAQIREVEQYAIQLTELQTRQREQLREMMIVAAADARFLDADKGKAIATDEDMDAAMPDQQVEGVGPSRRRTDEGEDLGLYERLGWSPGPARGVHIAGGQPSREVPSFRTRSPNLLTSETLGTLGGGTGSLNTGNLLASETLGTAAEDGGDGFDNVQLGGAHQVAPQAAESDSDSDGRSPFIPPQEDNAGAADEQQRSITYTRGPGVEIAARDEDRPRDENGELIRSQVGNSDTQPAAGEPPEDFLFAESQDRPTMVDGVLVPPRQAPPPPPVDPRERRRILLERVAEMERHDLFEAR